MSIPFNKRIFITAAKRREWYEVLASMTSKESGLSVSDVLKDMHEEFKSVRHPMEPVVSRLITRMRGGKSGVQVESLRLGDSLKGLVPPNEAMMIKAGEERGEVSRGLRQAAAYVGSSDELIGLVRKAVAVFGLYFLGIVAMNVFFSVELLPQMQLSSPRHSWPGYAQVYGWVADHMVYITIALLLMVAGVWWGFKYLFRTWRTRGREFADRRIWPFTTVRLMNSSALLVSLGGFVKVGSPFVEAIEIVSKGANPYMTGRFRLIKSSMKSGSTDYDALLASKLIPEDREWIIRCYGKTTDFGAALDQISVEFMKYALRRTEKIAAMLNLILMFLVAANIGWVGSTVSAIVKSVR